MKKNNRKTIYKQKYTFGFCKTIYKRKPEKQFVKTYNKTLTSLYFKGNKLKKKQEKTISLVSLYKIFGYTKSQNIRKKLRKKLYKINIKRCLKNTFLQKYKSKKKLIKTCKRQIDTCNKTKIKNKFDIKI